jgi:hypothetical protein
LLANFATESDTTWRVIVRTFHTQQVLVHLLGQFGGNKASLRFVGFTPIKRNTKVGATGSAGYTGIFFAHYVTSRNRLGK